MTLDEIQQKFYGFALEGIDILSYFLPGSEFDSLINNVNESCEGVKIPSRVKEVTLAMPTGAVQIKKLVLQNPAPEGWMEI